jgi:hypothetical protein
VNTQTIPMEADQSLEIQRTGGDLVVQGWDRSELEARGDGVQCEQSEGRVTISSRGDLVLSIPRSVRLLISAVGGDAHLENLEGTIDLSVVGGDAVLRNLAGAVSLNGPVGGETRFDNVARISVAGGRSGHGLLHHLQRGTDQAQRGTDAHPHRVEGKLRHAERKLGRLRPGLSAHFGQWLGSRRGGTVMINGSQEPVSDEERMVILTMLQDKKITSEQADALLAALEGRQENPQPSGSPSEEAGS